jgi:hypothetical protein
MFHHCRQLRYCLDEMQSPLSSARVELVSPFYQTSSCLAVFFLIFLDHVFLSVHNIVTFISRASQRLG